MGRQCTPANPETPTAAGREPTAARDPSSLNHVPSGQLPMKTHGARPEARGPPSQGVVMFMNLLMLAPQSSSGSSTGGAIAMIIYLAIIIFVLAGMWKTFVKAGQPGWGVLIPFYNLYLFCKIAGRPGWWFILMLIPIVGFIVSIIVDLDIAKNFGKSVGFAIGLIFLPFIFFPILGFGSAEYNPAPARSPAFA
jgi:uncharacterized membrane protein YhaH (DUF805 family)